MSMKKRLLHTTAMTLTLAIGSVGLVGTFAGDLGAAPAFASCNPCAAKCNPCAPKS